eukprot:3200778-Amphidinium_carterae.1
MDQSCFASQSVPLTINFMLIPFVALGAIRVRQNVVSNINQISECHQISNQVWYQGNSSVKQRRKNPKRGQSNKRH